ncbi:MAG: hypothetical protein K9N07_08025 [Candidatus Cloacimonetes bacterium]|nr:hypothetical protein [Candidatus Cloacimonadota bacterium]
MNFLKAAVEMEELIKKYYIDLAEKCSYDQQLKTLLTILAADHEQHLEKFLQMSSRECTNLETTRSYEATIEFFQNLQKDKETFSCEIDQLSLYKRALDLVGKKLILYNEYRSTLASGTDRTVLDAIIKVEDQHRFVLGNIIEMLRSPLQWIEKSEFYFKENFIEDYTD